MTKLEEIARAIFEDFMDWQFGEPIQYEGPPLPAEELARMDREWRDREWKEQRECYVRFALAAVRAMREPSEAMMLACPVQFGAQAVRYNWTAMIDAILSEAGER